MLAEEESLQLIDLCFRCSKNNSIFINSDQLRSGHVLGHKIEFQVASYQSIELYFCGLVFTSYHINHVSQNLHYFSKISTEHTLVCLSNHFIILVKYGMNYKSARGYVTDCIELHDTPFITQGGFLRSLFTETKLIVL